MGQGRPGPALFTDRGEALAEAVRQACARGAASCVVSRFSPKRGVTVYRIMSMRGFGLPPGWTFEETVEPGRERVEIEPPEKSSTNGF
ncbi:MAG: hypothetical protein QUS11_00035 [Candidatus Fermentibacter sp.]|nr:hypothetical protein [Candidatus Fermentibacter sp.]